MKKQDVVVGGKYMAKVSGGVVPVQIREERWIGGEHKGWLGVNTVTNRAVTIKTAQRLRAVAASRGQGDQAAHATAGTPKLAVALPAKANRVKAGTKAAAKPPTAANSAKPAKKADNPKATQRGATSRMSGLDAAARILAESKKALNCKELVAEAFKKNLWKSEGATPEATIYAAIIREIASKGSDARFKKTERGRFAAR